MVVGLCAIQKLFKSSKQRAPRSHVLRKHLNECQPMPFSSKPILVRRGVSERSSRLPYICGVPFAVFEQQTSFSSSVALQVLCNVRVQVNLPLRSGSLQILHDSRRIFLDLLFDQDGSSIVDEVSGVYGQRFGNAHPGCGQKNVQRLLLTGA